MQTTLNLNPRGILADQSDLYLGDRISVELYNIPVLLQKTTLRYMVLILRLLDSSTLQFKKLNKNRLPRYALLSHTWGNEEVSYEDTLWL
jgi:hypothetical protein